MSISEVFGEFRCGKTQLSHTMSVIAQLPKTMGGADGKVAYIDTEGTFRPERIAQIAERFGVDPEAAQENIAYARALNSEHQLELLNTLSREFAEGQYRLLVIDSIMNCFRVDYCGRGELAERQQKLNQFLMRLAHMAEGKDKTMFLFVVELICFRLLIVMLTILCRVQCLCLDGKCLALVYDSGFLTDSSRQIKFRVTLVRAHFSPVPMAVSPSVDMCLPMRLPLVCSFAKAEARSVSQRFRTLLVSSSIRVFLSYF